MAAASLFAAVAAMRDGRLDEAASRFALARAELVRHSMSEWIDDLDSRRLELDVLAGWRCADAADELAARLGSASPFRVRTLRAAGLAHEQAGNGDRAQQLLLQSLDESSPGFEQALTMLALAQVAPLDVAAERRQRAIEILDELGVRRQPPMRPSDLSLRR